eukprot:COSAG02_NODE_9791_length_2109_cov_121.867754_1_plen_42_part_10
MMIKSRRLFTHTPQRAVSWVHSNPHRLADGSQIPGIQFFASG